MKRKVKVCKYDVRTHKMEVVEEEMDFPDVEIKMHNPIEELHEKISEIELWFKALNERVSILEKVVYSDKSNLSKAKNLVEKQSIKF